MKSGRISADSSDESGRSSSESEAEREPRDPGRRLGADRPLPADEFREPSDSPGGQILRLGKASGTLSCDSLVMHHSGYLLRNSSIPPVGAKNRNGQYIHHQQHNFQLQSPQPMQVSSAPDFKFPVKKTSTNHFHSGRTAEFVTNKEINEL